MFNLRGCPKCHGDLCLGQDIYGTYLSCIQCGRYFSIPDAPDRGGRPVPDARPVGPPEAAELEMAA